MRIAVVNQEAEGGATVIAKSLAALLEQGGDQVLYLGPPWKQTTESLLATLEEFAPDVVHLHCFFNAYPYSALEPLGRRHRVVFTVHDLFPTQQLFTACWTCRRYNWCLPCPEVGWRRKLEVFRGRLSKRRSNERFGARLVVPSRWLEERIARTELGRLPIRHIPYGIDVGAFARREGGRERLGIPPTGRVLLFAGNMYSPQDHRKGLPDLLAAMAEIRAAVPEVRLVVAGQVYEIDVSSDVLVLGSLGLERMPDVFSAADVFVNPTRGETGGITNMEAAACGVPVVSTGVTAVPEYVEHGRTGLLVPIGDRAALVRAMTSILCDPERARSVGREGKRLARECFDVCAMVGRYRLRGHDGRRSRRPDRRQPAGWSRRRRT
jgi:glycosyltransferase involved in cell wall biosynthesis